MLRKKVDPALIARFRPSMLGCFVPVVDPTTTPVVLRKKSIRWVRDFFFEGHSAPSRLPVVTRRLTDLASRGEQSVLSQARYCVGGSAVTECRTSTEAKTSSQDLNSHGCLPVNMRSSFLRVTGQS